MEFLKKNNKIIFKLLFYILISVAIFFLATIGYLYLTDFESLKNIDPIPPDFSINIAESEKKGVLVSKYISEKQFYYFNKSEFSIKEVWLEKFSKEQKENNKYGGNFKLIITFNNLSIDTNYGILNYLWMLDSNRYYEESGLLFQNGHLIFRFNTLPKKNIMFLNIYERDSVQNNIFLGSIKLFKKKSL